MNQPQETEDVIRDLDDFFAEDLASAAASDDVVSLDALLNESMAAVAQDREVKEQRKRLARGNLGDAERLYIEGKVREWELARVWTPAASVAYFEVQLCEQCGALHHHFRGYFQRQVHKVSAIDRWIAVDKGQCDAAMALPKEMKEDLVGVSTCAQCCADAGWVSHG